MLLCAGYYGGKLQTTIQRYYSLTDKEVVGYAKTTIVYLNRATCGGDKLYKNVAAGIGDMYYDTLQGKIDENDRLAIVNKIKNDYKTTGLGQLNSYITSYVNNNLLIFDINGHVQPPINIPAEVGQTGFLESAPLREKISAAYGDDPTNPYEIVKFYIAGKWVNEKGNEVSKLPAWQKDINDLYDSYIFSGNYKDDKSKTSNAFFDQIKHHKLKEAKACYQTTQPSTQPAN